MFFKRFTPQSLKRKLIIACITALLWTPVVSFAQPSIVPTPRLKPAVPNTSEILSAQDVKLFRSAMRAGDRRGWTEVKRLEGQIGDPTARNVLLWRRAVSNGRTSLSELTRVVHNLPDWPSMVTVRSKAEKLMFDTPLSASETISWFRGEDPVSGEGRAALARAYYQLGDQAMGDRWLKYAWHESRLTRDRQRTLFSRYKNRLSPDDHAARADYLIWLGTRNYSSAEALLPHMSAADRKLMTARIRVGANRSGMDSAIKALTTTQAKDTALLFERAYWRRKRKDKNYALPVYLEMNAPASTEPGKDRLWFEKKLMSYWLMEDKKYQDAYDIVQHHGYDRGANFAEAEFIAGWLALTKLGRPTVAAEHFEVISSGVSLPVSLSRAYYWQGRAAEALGDPTHVSHYNNAAQFVNTYYGQLSAAKLDTNAMVILPPEADTAILETEFNSRELIKALRLVGEVQNDATYRRLSYHLDDRVETAQELSLLSNIAREYQYISPSVRAAKQSGRFKAVLTESSYPMPLDITSLGTGYDIPFTLAIARQESEFNASAVSSARAYGMMQMIDATARATARKHGLRYNRAWLTTDNSYSAKLGSLHLNDLLERYGGSYIMAAAAYNAGPTRVSQWIQRYGDPRTGQINPIDWVESIPFSETRNYVMRVMENKQVYQARLNGNSAPLSINADLNRGYSP